MLYKTVALASFAVTGAFHVVAPAPASMRAASVVMNGGKGFGGGEATRDPTPTVYDPNDPKGKQQAIHKAESFAEYLAKRAGGGGEAPAPAPAPMPAPAAAAPAPAAYAAPTPVAGGEDAAKAAWLAKLDNKASWTTGGMVMPTAPVAAAYVPPPAPVAAAPAPVAAAPAPMPAAAPAAGSAGSVASTLATIQGPDLYWEELGPLQNPMKEESDFKEFDKFDLFLDACAANGVDLNQPDITVFAPSNRACEQFSAVSGPLTADVCAYHIVKGKVPVASLSSTPLTTVQGGTITYRRMFRKDFIDNAFCAAAASPPRTSYKGDIQADNGVIHFINEVIYPGWTESAGGYGSA